MNETNNSTSSDVSNTTAEMPVAEPGGSVDPNTSGVGSPLPVSWLIWGAVLLVILFIATSFSFISLSIFLFSVN